MSLSRISPRSFELATLRLKVFHVQPSKSSRPGAFFSGLGEVSILKQTQLSEKTTLSLRLGDAFPTALSACSRPCAFTISRLNPPMKPGERSIGEHGTQKLILSECEQCGFLK